MVDQILMPIFPYFYSILFFFFAIQHVHIRVCGHTNLPTLWDVLRIHLIRQLTAKEMDITKNFNKKLIDH